MIQKITDPSRITTDLVMLSYLKKQGIDKDYVEFVQDYAKRVKGKSSPYMKLYRDLKSNKRFAVISQLPMVDADGNKVEVGWKEAGINYFAEKNNLFRAKVQSAQVEITIRNDQPDGRKAGNKLSFKPQLFLDGIEQKPSNPALLFIDPVNPNYSQNVLEWDYGICKRRLRIIEGGLLGSWVFDSKPSGTVRIKYNQTGDYRLKLGQFAVDDDTEVITSEQFDEIARLQGYPVTVSDTDTFYPDADPETSTVDGTVWQNGGDKTWAAIRDGAGSGASDSGATGLLAYLDAGGIANRWDYLNRGIFLFDTSAIGSAAVIQSAVFSIYGYGKSDPGGWVPNVNVYSSNPTSSTGLVASDYATLGTIPYCDTPITYAGWNVAGYNDFTLNASGLAAISKTGVTKLGARNANYDVANSAPAWASQREAYLRIYHSEQGDGFKPKLVIEYTVLAYIGGTVTKSGVGVEGAKVYCIKQSTNKVIATTTTDINGDYEFSAADGLALNVKYHLAVEYEDVDGKYNAESLWNVEAGQPA